MKKYLNLSMAYAIAAMAGGVFYREFTKWNGFTGVTALGKVHTHLFMLGMIMFLIVALFAERYPLSEQKTFRMFVRVYNMGVPVTSLMMAVRGITQVLDLPLSKGVSSAISGIAGIGHILTGAGMILLLLSLRKAARREQ